jgi:hypothetical protein
MDTFGQRDDSLAVLSDRQTDSLRCLARKRTCSYVQNAGPTKLGSMMVKGGIALDTDEADEIPRW